MNNPLMSRHLRRAVDVQPPGPQQRLQLTQGLHRLKSLRLRLPHKLLRSQLMSRVNNRLMGRRLRRAVDVQPPGQPQPPTPGHPNLKRLLQLQKHPQTTPVTTSRQHVDVVPLVEQVLAHRLKLP